MKEERGSQDFHPWRRIGLTVAIATLGVISAKKEQYLIAGGLLAVLAMLNVMNNLDSWRRR